MTLFLIPYSLFLFLVIPITSFGSLSHSTFIIAALHIKVLRFLLTIAVGFRLPLQFLVFFQRSAYDAELMINSELVVETKNTGSDGNVHYRFYAVGSAVIVMTDTNVKCAQITEAI